MANEYFARHRQYQLIESGCGLRYIIRIWGVLTAFVTYALGATSQLHNHRFAGLLIVITSFLIFILEIKWLIRFILLKFCCNGVFPNNFIWEFCTTFGEMCSGWRLSFPYVILAIGFLIWHQKIWLSYAAGVQLLILSLLRLLTVLRCQSTAQEENLLPQYNFEKIIGGMKGEEKVSGDYRKAPLGPSLENLEPPLDEIC